MFMKFKFLFVMAVFSIFNILNVSQLYAQSALYDFSELGIFPSDNSVATARVSCDPALKNIETSLIEANKKRHSYGYSVQIFFDSGVDAQSNAEKVVERYDREKMSDKAYIFYEAPYFKVRVGDCRTRLAATKLKKSLEIQFPGSFIIECKISYPKL